MKVSEPTVIRFDKERNESMAKRKRQLREEALDAMSALESMHSQRLRRLEAEASAPRCSEHQWLDVAIDIHKHNLLALVERIVLAGQHDVMHIHDIEDGMAELLRKAYQARSALRDSLLNQLTEGSVDVSAKWREVHSVRISILQKKQEDEKKALSMADNDILAFDSVQTSIEVEFQHKVRSAGFADLLQLDPVKLQHDSSTRIQQIRTSMVNNGVEIEESLRRLEEHSGIIDDERCGQAEKREFESVRKKARLLAKALSEGYFDDSLNAPMLRPLSQDETSERPALSRRLPSPRRDLVPRMKPRPPLRDRSRSGADRRQVPPPPRPRGDEPPVRARRSIPPPPRGSIPPPPTRTADSRSRSRPSVPRRNGQGVPPLPRSGTAGYMRTKPVRATIITNAERDQRARQGAAMQRFADVRDVRDVRDRVPERNDARGRLPERQDRSDAASTQRLSVKQGMNRRCW
jgi:hypothetical protein